MADKRIPVTISRALFSLLLSSCLLATLSLASPGTTYGGQATVAWDPETASGLAGYRVHYGTASRNYSLNVDAGNQATATVTGLTAGATYYFAATAYDTAGNESAFSNEATYTVPSSCSYSITPGSVSPTAAGGTVSVAVATQGTCNWNTANPASWVTIASGGSGTGNGTVSYSVSANTGSDSRTAAITVAGLIFTVTQAGVSVPPQPSTYTVTASTGTGGSISPSGTVNVNGGGGQAFTITPNNGYTIQNVVIDGVSMGQLTSYIFSNVAANHTIQATFKQALVKLPRGLAKKR